MNKAFFATIAPILRDLTDAELSGLNLAVNFPGYNVKSIPCYEKVQDLFTENDGAAMHQDTAAALAAVVKARLGS